MRIAKIDMGKYYKLPHPQLRSYLNRQVVGSDKVVTTPFANNVGFNSSVEEWKNVCESKLKDWPTLLAFELEMAGKIGPLSVQKPLVERMDSLNGYFYGMDNPQQPVDTVFIDATIKRWGVRGLQMISLVQALEMMKKSTNSGSPFFTKRRIVVENGLVGELVFMDGELWIVTPQGTFLPISTLGWRGQEGGPDPDDVKQRDLWMFAMLLNLYESQVYFPLVNWGQKSRQISSWLGNDAVDLRITELFNSKAPNDLILCSDFTKIDHNWGISMQDCAQTMLTKMFRNTPELSWWLKHVYPYKYNGPLCISWGRAMFGHHGMSSGSGGTNADETLGHSVLQTECAMTAGRELNPNSMCLGDDGILSYPGLEVEHCTDIFASHGNVMNPDKQNASTDDCIYLRRWHHKDYRIDNVCVGVYSTLRALGKLKYMERFHDPKTWGPKAIVTRSLSIIENCCYHPLREEFLDFCIKRDKFRLGLDIPGYLDSFGREVKEAVANDVLGYQYTDTLNPKPATSWWVYRALRARQK